MRQTLTFVILCCVAVASPCAGVPAEDGGGAATAATAEDPGGEGTGNPAPEDPGSAERVFAGLPLMEPGRDFHVGDPELGRLLRIMLRENPDILAARRAWLSSRERPAQARSLPDPMLGFGYFLESIETRVGPQQYNVSLTQTVPWPSKLSTEGRRSERVAASLGEGVRQVERDRIRDFKNAYYSALYNEQALRINGEEQHLLSRFEQIALTRYATGEGIQQNVIKVQTEITRLIDQATSLRERRDIFLRRMAQLLGRPEQPLPELDADLSAPELDFDMQALEARALEARPSLGALRETVRAGELFVRRRRLDFRPNFSFGITYTDVGRRSDPAAKAAPPPDDGEDALALVAGVTIPLYGRRIASGVREAQESLNADVQHLDQQMDQVRFDVQEAGLRLISLRERTALYRDNLIPQAEQSLSSSEAAYQTDQIDFLDLLDAERVWFQVRLTYRRLLSDVWIALADVERAIGGKFPA